MYSGSAIWRIKSLSIKYVGGKGPFIIFPDREMHCVANRDFNKSRTIFHLAVVWPNSHLANRSISLLSPPFPSYSDFSSQKGIYVYHSSSDGCMHCVYNTIFLVLLIVRTLFLIGSCMLLKKNIAQ